MTQRIRSLRSLVRAGHVTLAPRLLDTREKEYLAENKTVFTLLAIREVSEGASSFWEHTILLNGERCSFRLGLHEARDATARDLAKALYDGPVDGVLLLSLSEKQGNQFLVLAPFDPETQDDMPF